VRKACQKTGRQVHAYCLMNNHFHLVLETPRANLVDGMRWFLGTYTARFNRRHKFFGHLFSGRYKSLLVDGRGEGYLKTVCDYVHLNPVRAGRLNPEQPLREYRWSSWPEYLHRPGRRPGWLRVDRLLGEWSVRRDDAAGRRELEAALEQRRRAEAGAPRGAWQEVRRGWCLGAESFREKLLALAAGERGQQHYGEAAREADEQKARRLLQELLARAGWTAAELARRRKTDRKKAQMAARLRAETTMTWPWIASHLAMGHWRTAANACRSTVVKNR
jgi:REP element-mobilizing transposase RayT